MIYLHTIYVTNDKEGRYVKFYSLNKKEDQREIGLILGLFGFNEYCFIDVTKVIP